MPREMIAIVDFGSQYGQLIARRVREHNVYSMIVPADGESGRTCHSRASTGIILSGGPASVYAKDAPRCDPAIFELGVPILGICYGMQIGCKILGANVAPAKSREYGRTNLTISDTKGLLRPYTEHTTVWMSHGDQVNQLNGDFESHWRRRRRVRLRRFGTRASHSTACSFTRK